MRLKVFTVYDSKVEAYMQPFQAVTTGQAIRDISDIVNEKPDHPFSKHPSDFTLFEIAEYDDSHGVYEMHETKRSLGNLLEMKIDKTPWTPRETPDLVEPIRKEH